MTSDGDKPYIYQRCIAQQDLNVFGIFYLRPFRDTNIQQKICKN